jgi:nucleoside-diphosphate-sugar epimerase
MPRILIAGCGYVGEAIADLFHKAGWNVEGWTASEESAGKLSAKPYPIRAVDISDRDQVAASTEDFDAVIHCASTRGGNADLYRRVYLDGARNLIARFTRSTFLFTSSTSVYAQKNGELVTEESVAEPQHETGNFLREAEEVVLGHGGIVVRLAGIYGPGRSSLLRKFVAGQAQMDAATERFINQVHRDDIASALFFLLNRTIESQKRAEAEGAIFNIVDDQPTVQRECYEWLAARLHRPLPGVATSPPARRRGDSDKRVSNEKLRTLGWKPRYPSFQAGMSESVLPNFERLGA